MCDSSNNAEVTTVSSSAASSNWQWRIKSSASFLRSSLTTCGKSLLQMEQTYIQALPKPMVEFADSSRAIAVARLPAAHRGTQFRAVVTEGTHKGELCIKVVAVTYSGFFYRCVSAGGGTALLLVLISALGPRTHGLHLLPAACVNDRGASMTLPRRPFVREHEIRPMT